MIHNKIRVGTLIIILFSFVFLPDTQAAAYGEEKQITVVFRYDDYSGSSSTDIEVKLIDAFLKRGIPCVFGVIPFQCVGDVHDPGPQNIEPLTPVKVDILKSAIKAGFLEIALHGYSHQTMREKRYTEFEGLDYNSQVEKIEKGKKYLEETLQIKVDTFIPPWNSYDLNTIMVLEKMGFKTISAYRVGAAKESSKLKYLPETCDLLNLRNAVASARNIPEVNQVIIVIFHELIFVEVDKKNGMITYQDFLELLDWVTSQKDVHVRSIDQTTAVIDDLSAKRFIDYSAYCKVYSAVPKIQLFLSKLYKSKVYLSSKHSHDMKVKCLALILPFYLALLAVFVVISYSTGSNAFFKRRFVSLIFRYSILVLLVLVLFYLLRDFSVSSTGATIIAALAGTCIGTWASFLRCKRK